MYVLWLIWVVLDRICPEKEDLRACERHTCAKSRGLSLCSPAKPSAAKVTKNK